MTTEPAAARAGTDEPGVVPVPGQLVTVRNRQWVVSDVLRGEVSSSDAQVLTGQVDHLGDLGGRGIWKGSTAWQQR